MTPEEHQALHCLVAEKVMGWDRDNEANNSGFNPAFFFDGAWRYGRNPDALAATWRPSTDIAHAWIVVERMRELGHRLRLGENEDGTAFEAAFPTQGEHGELIWSHEADVALTAPVAICLAALKAVK